MSRLMHLTALLLSLLVGGQSMASVGEGWLCNATGAPMPGCPCTTPHTEDGEHPDEDGFASTPCCERIQSLSEAPAPAATTASKQSVLEKVLVPLAVLPVPEPARVEDRLRVPPPESPRSSGPPVYLRVRHLLI